MDEKTFCRRADITPGDLVSYEGGDLRLPASLLFRVAEVLDIPIETFFQGLAPDVPKATEIDRPRSAVLAGTLTDGMYRSLSRQTLHHMRFLRRDEAIALFELTKSIADHRIGEAAAFDDQNC